MCDKGFIWNPSNCERSKCRKCRNCKCRKSLIDKLIEVHSKNIYENET